MTKFTLLPEKNNRPLLWILLLILLLLMVVIVFHCQHHNFSHHHVSTVMTEVKNSLQQRNATNLAQQITQLEVLSSKISDPQLAARVRENAALLTMIHQVWAHQEVQAIQLFADRYRQNRGQMIYLESFDEVLPYAKQTMLNVFLKQLDLQGAYCFMFSYPPVLTGKHVKYFAAMEQFLCGDPAGAEQQLKALLNSTDDRPMVQSAINYLGRLRKRGIAPRTAPAEPEVPRT